LLLKDVDNNTATNNATGKTLTFHFRLYIKIHLDYVISETVRDRGSVPKDHQ